MRTTALPLLRSSEHPSSEAVLSESRLGLRSWPVSVLASSSVKTDVEFTITAQGARVCQWPYVWHLLYKVVAAADMHSVLNHNCPGQHLTTDLRCSPHA